MITLVTSMLLFAAQPGPDAYQLNRQGRDLLDQHRYPAAVRVFRRAVDQAELQLGLQDPATAMILRNLALAYVQSGDHANAEQRAKQAFSIMESRFGANDPALAPILNVLAECYASSGLLTEAQRASEQAVSIGRAAGVHYGIALHNLAALREFSGDFEGAAFLYRSAIVVKIETLGAGHRYVAMSKAALRRVQGREHLATRGPSPLKLEQAD